MSTRGIVFGAVSPHPPIVVPEIGETELEKCRATRDGLQEMAAQVVDARPDTVIIISPHGPVVREAVTLVSSPILEGNFREFGISGSSLRYGNDLRLVNRIIDEAAARGVDVFPADPQRAASLRLPGALHYSVLVPLYYLRQAGYEGRLVAGAVGLLPNEEFLDFGRAVQAACAELGVRAVYVASGDLSHRLTDGAPAGYDPLGRVFDEKVVAALARADLQALLDLEPSLIERAGECGLGPILTLFGALDGLELIPRVLSYEGPFGVGYCVATFLPKGPKAEPAPAPGPGARTEPATEPGAVSPPGGDSGPQGRPGAGSRLGPEPEPGARPEPELGAKSEPEPAARAEPGTEAEQAETERPQAQTPAEAEPAPPAAQPHPFVRLARLSLETYVRSGRLISPPTGSPGLDRRAGAFVSLKKHGQLRGCIGTISPTCPTLAEEVIRNAVQAGTADPRFPPVQEDELGELTYSVDVLEPAEPVTSVDELDPKVYGVIVTKGRRTGLLLPDLEGIDTVEDQVAIAMQKAGLRPDETGVTLYRFRVTRYY